MKELLEAQVRMLYVKSQDTNVPSLQNGESAGALWSCASGDNAQWESQVGRWIRVQEMGGQYEYAVCSERYPAL